MHLEDLQKNINYNGLRNYLFYLHCKIRTMYASEMLQTLVGLNKCLNKIVVLTKMTV